MSGSQIWSAGSWPTAPVAKSAVRPARGVSAPLASASGVLSAASGGCCAAGTGPPLARVTRNLPEIRSASVVRGLPTSMLVGRRLGGEPRLASASPVACDCRQSDEAARQLPACRLSPRWRCRIPDRPRGYRPPRAIDDGGVTVVTRISSGGDGLPRLDDERDRGGAIARPANSGRARGSGPAQAGSQNRGVARASAGRVTGPIGPAQFGHLDRELGTTVPANPGTAAGTGFSRLSGVALAAGSGRRSERRRTGFPARPALSVPSGRDALRSRTRSPVRRPAPRRTGRRTRQFRRNRRMPLIGRSGRTLIPEKR